MTMYPTLDIFSIFIGILLGIAVGVAILCIFGILRIESESRMRKAIRYEEQRKKEYETEFDKMIEKIVEKVLKKVEENKK